MSPISENGQSLAGSMEGRQWRSLDELADTDEFRQYLDAEFPDQSYAGLDPISRRDLLRLMGASFALAGLVGCTQTPTEKIVPYVRAPEEFIPGQPLYFATTIPLGGFGKGVIVESHLGRPTKVEGNPGHPASLGATDIFGQASVLGLYDPDRAQVVTHQGRISDWPTFVTALQQALGAQRAHQGSGLRILSERMTSPTLVTQLRAVLSAFPNAKWHQYEPITGDNARNGTRLAFGAPLQTRYAFDTADVVVSFDADFLGTGPANLHDTRRFASRRQSSSGHAVINRLYVFESTPSITGSMADHRVRMQAAAIEAAAFRVARSLAGRAPTGDPFLDALVQDLTRHRGSSLILAGEAQPARVHALAHLMNASLGNAGHTVEYTDPVESSPDGDVESLHDLVTAMDRGAVELLVILASNPVLTAPRDFAFRERLSRVPLRVHLSLYADETSALCHWHIPEAHVLESWGDTRAFDGTASIIQPLIAPLYAGKSAYELVAALTTASDQSTHDLVQSYWRSQWPGPDFEERWERTLNDGVVAGTAFAPKAAMVKTSLDALAGPTRAPSGLEIVFRPDSTIWDGRFANSAWLQELPKPMTRLTWDNAALLSPGTAARFNLASGDILELHYRGTSLRAPAWITPGQADDSVAVTLGYGRVNGGRVATGHGFNAYPLRTSDAPWFGDGLQIVKTGERYDLASTQHHFSMEGRDLVRVQAIGTRPVGSGSPTPQEPSPTLAATGLGTDGFAATVAAARQAGEPPPGETLYPPYPYSGHAWGLSVDLNVCTGCSACVVACQAENNIPVVGKTEVGRGREMHWIRIDRYFEGDPENPAIYHQPVMCMHCENAPCELVCPVGATVHSDEGLNQMVYNRCVGTRYCSNNCPYKVRRFNFFQYADWTTPSLKPLRNPNVTVRSRGVMEKCTYCVQRINAAKIRAEKEDRPVRDGEIVTACEAACPAQAIVFGDLNDPKSRVAQLKAQSRTYGLLVELNTRPRTTYLSRLTNANPDLAPKAGHGD